MLIEAVRGDITTQRVDAIVNAANSSLLGGGGVDGAIHATAGPVLLDECREIRRTTWPNGLPPGESVATGAGNLRARYVIHTVGPTSRTERGPELLAACHRNSLAIADERGLASIAFPAISCGAFGWRTRDAAPIGVRTVRDFARVHPLTSIIRVRFVLFDDDALADYAAALSSAVE
jgi:O-acetyl-ADP-ribose deacetylase (regulator of RNase III)